MSDLCFITSSAPYFGALSFARPGGTLLSTRKQVSNVSVSKNHPRAQASFPDSAKPQTPRECTFERREHLLSLIQSFGRSGATQPGATEEVEAAVQSLLSSRTGDSEAPPIADDLSPTASENWVERLHGRWDLRFSTEGPLVRLMTVGAYPFFSAGDVYQVVEPQGKLQVSFLYAHGSSVYECNTFGLADHA